MEKDGAIITRMAPSPTGLFHIGSARTALFNYLYARANGGSFILRSEDTDRERSKTEYEEDVLSAMRWLGLDWDDFYRQSERTDVYKKYIEKMLADGTAYVSKEEPKEEGQRSEVIRAKNPNKRVKFTDVVRGDIEFDTTELGDFVIARSIEEPLYHLSVVVDDFEMGISHVIRGDDGISNTPRQILLQEAIGAPRPVYAHLPLIVGSDRAKLSKRHAAVSVTSYREMGFLPDALINYMALLGWNPGDEKEVFERQELLEAFSLENAQKGAAMFSSEKLRWINREHLSKLPSDELAKNIEGHIRSLEIFKTHSEALEPKLKHITDLLAERISVYSDIDDLFGAGEFDYLIKKPAIEPEKLRWKDTELDRIKNHLERIIELIKNINETDFNESVVKDAIWEYASEQGRGEVLWPMRYALTGRDKSPDPFKVSEILGKDETLKRIESAISIL